MAESQSASPLAAGALVAAGAFFFSIMGLFVKLSENHTHCTTFSLMAVRCAFGLLFNGVATALDLRAAAPLRAEVAALATPHPSRSRSRGFSFSSQDTLRAFGGPSTCLEWVWLLVRSFGGFACILLEYQAMTVLPLATNTMIVYSSPAFIVLWAALLLRERLRLPVACCIGVCFSGLVLIVQPWKHDLGAPVWGYLMAGGAAASAGLVYVSLKELKKVKYHFVLFFFQLVTLILAVVCGVALKQFPIPPWGSPSWGYLTGVAVAAYAAEVCITLGFPKATPETLGQVSVLKFLSPIFSAMWGAIFLKTVPAPVQFCGMGLVLVASGSIMFMRAAPKKSQETKNPQLDLEDGQGFSSDTSGSTGSGSGSSSPATETASSEAATSEQAAPEAALARGSAETE